MPKNISVKVSDFKCDRPGFVAKKGAFPDNFVVTFSYNSGATIRSSGNCGVGLMEHAYGKWTVSGYKNVPEEYRDGWGMPIQVIATAAADHLVHLQEETLKAPEDVGDLVDGIVKIAKNSGYHCLIITDGVNKHHKKARGGTYKGAMCTADFAEILWQKKIGYIVQCPVSLNHVHNTVGDLSLVRVWVWYPPGALAFKIKKDLLGKGEIYRSAEEAGEAAAKARGLVGAGKNDYLSCWTDWETKDDGFKRNVAP